MRLLKERDVYPILTTAGAENINIGYDCGGHDLISVNTLNNHSHSFDCNNDDEINDLKDAVRYFYRLGKNDIRVIYDRSDINAPYREEQPYKAISERASARAGVNDLGSTAV